MKDITIAGRYYSQVFGSTLPGPIWKEAMTGASEGKAANNFILQSSVGLQPARGASVSYLDRNTPLVPLDAEFEFTNPEPIVPEEDPTLEETPIDPATSGQDPAPAPQDPAPVVGQ